MATKTRTKTKTKKKAVKNSLRIDFPDALQSIGKMKGIIYSEEGKNTLLVHTFLKPPTIFIDKKNTIMVMHGGKYKYSQNKGFEG